jgi:predicted esterase
MRDDDNPSWLPLPTRPPAPLPAHVPLLSRPQVLASNQQLPFFVGHGSVDQLIPPVIATTTQEVLEGLGCTKVEFHM